MARGVPPGCATGYKGGTRRIIAPDAAGAALVEALTEAGASVNEDLLMRACQHGRSRTALALLDAGASLNTGTKSLVGAARRAKCHALADELEGGALHQLPTIVKRGPVLVTT